MKNIKFVSLLLVVLLLTSLFNVPLARRNFYARLDIINKNHKTLSTQNYSVDIEKYKYNLDSIDFGFTDKELEALTDYKSVKRTSTNDFISTKAAKSDAELFSAL